MYTPLNMEPSIWGNITRCMAIRTPIMSEGPGGETYIADTHGPAVYRLTCQCGHEWDILQSEFPGRRKVRSCGRVECPHTPQPKRRFKQHGRAASVYLSAERYAWVEALAQKNDWPFSKAVDEAIGSAMLAELMADD